MEQPTTELISLKDKENRLVQRGIIDAYEEALRQHVGSDRGDMDKINDEGLQEFLVGGAYTRVLHIPAGNTIVSNLWNRDRLWIIIYGEVAVRTEQGEMRIVAPYIGEAPFGSKVALVTITDTLWAAITGLPETDDVSEAEKYIKAESYDELKYPWENQ